MPAARSPSSSSCARPRCRGARRGGRRRARSVGHGRARLRDRRRLTHRETVELEVHPAEQAQRLDRRRRRAPLAAGRSHRRRMVTVGCGLWRRRPAPGALRGRPWASSGPGLPGRWPARRRCRGARRGSTRRRGPTRCAASSTRCTSRAEHVYGLEPPACVRQRSRGARRRARLRTRRDRRGRRGRLDLGRRGRRPLLHEWRGALFRVRLARLRLARPRRVPSSWRLCRADLARPLVAFLLALVGALAFVAGATLAAWPLWVAGLSPSAARSSPIALTDRPYPHARLRRLPIEMMNRAPHLQGARSASAADPELPRPTLQFRLTAWRAFQRALDPLAPPKPLRRPRPR